MQNPWFVWWPCFCFWLSSQLCVSFIVTQHNASSQLPLPCHFHWHFHIICAVLFIERVKCTLPEQTHIPTYWFHSCTNTFRNTWLVWNKSTSLHPAPSRAQTRLTAVAKTQHEKRAMQQKQCSCTQAHSVTTCLLLSGWICRHVLLHLFCIPPLGVLQLCTKAVLPNVLQLLLPHNELPWNRRRAADTQ